MESVGPQRTPLFEEHIRLGARMISFGGWEMPVSYRTGIIAEHHATRRAAGLFDISHMGEFVISGAGAPALLDALLTNDAGALVQGRALYSPICRDDGTIVDDAMLYHASPPSLVMDALPSGTPLYLLVVNAANIAKDLAWVQHLANRLALPDQVDIVDHSPATALIALQGPHALAILAEVAGHAVESIGHFHVAPLSLSGLTVVVARTGYTGEDGFELFVPAPRAVDIWRLLLEAGQPWGLIPAGLGARDTLRLEARLCLYGNDIDDSTTPLEAGLGWTVAWSKPQPFVGRDALTALKAAGLQRRLAGLIMDDRAVPRHGATVYADGQAVGTVTSGTMSPTLSQGIALAYLPPAWAAVGAALSIDVRGVAHPAHVVKTPFYRRPAG